MNLTNRGAILTACVLSSLAAAHAAGPRMPTFFARRDYANLYASFIQVADTNGDGIPDLIASQQGFIEVLFGNGNGTFQTNGHTTNAVVSGPSFAATDVNGDGKVDLVFAVGNGIAVCMGNGDGTFQRGVFYTVTDSGFLGFLVVGDFNGDGTLDVASAGNFGVWLFTGKGNGTFNSGALAATLAPGSTLIDAADFNGDGKLDLVVTVTAGGTNGSGAGSVLLLGNGNGTFQIPKTLSEPQRPIGLAVGALTKGGPAGIAIADGNSSNVYLYFGNGAGGFFGPTHISLPGVDRDGLTIGDINGDGLPDLVSSNAYVAYGKGGGKFSNAVSYVIDGGGGPTDVVLADLRNNGLIDIVTSGYDAISVLLNEGKEQFEDGIWTTVTGGAGCGVTADFNGDGKPDLAINNPQGITILLGTGKAAAPFTNGIPITLADADCLVTGDLNGDGKPDLLVPASGTVVAYLGNGDGTFTLASTTVTPSGGFLALGDFNHDGKPDFATSGNLLALGNGDGSFQAPTDIMSSPPSGGFAAITAGDINNDGWADLVLTSDVFPTNPNATVLLNNQSGGFTQVTTNFGVLTTQPILADMNGDGKLDLILSGGSGAAIYLGDGTGHFEYQVGLSGPSGASVGYNYVADVNADGIPDVLVTGFDTLVVYLGEKGATYASPFCIGVGPAPNDLLVANLHGQPPRFHLPDIVIPDASGGVMVLVNLTK